MWILPLDCWQLVKFNDGNAGALHMPTASRDSIDFEETSRLTTKEADEFGDLTRHEPRSWRYWPSSFLKYITIIAISFLLGYSTGRQDLSTVAPGSYKCKPDTAGFAN